MKRSALELIRDNLNAVRVDDPSGRWQVTHGKTGRMGMLSYVRAEPAPSEPDPALVTKAKP